MFQPKRSQPVLLGFGIAVIFSWLAYAPTTQADSKSIIKSFGVQPRTVTVFDFGKQVTTPSITASFVWCFEDGGKGGCLFGSRIISVGESGLVLAATKDDGGGKKKKHAPGVPGPYCIYWPGNPNAYDYCMDTMGSWFDGQRLYLDWESATDRDLGTVSQFTVTAEEMGGGGWSPATLAAGLSANPATGFKPLTTTLTATTSGTATGPTTYSFWWNCADTFYSVSAASILCGSLPSPPAGSCASNSSGAKCNEISATSQSVTNTYTTAGTFSAKVIAERSALSVTAPPAEARVTVNPTNPPPLSVSCTGTPASVKRFEPVTWSSLPAGGTGVYSYSWSGTDGLSGTGATVVKSYTTAGIKSAAITVTSGDQVTTRTCGTTVTVIGPTLPQFKEVPPD